MIKVFLAILLTGILTDNYILSKFLGICPFLGVSKKTETASGMGLAVIFVITIAAFVTGVINKFILANEALIQMGIDLRYLKTRINSTFLKLPKAEDHSEDYRCRYCLKQVEDVFEDMIIFNNMTNDEDYVKSKQQILYATVLGLIVDCKYASYYESDEFRSKCNKFTEEVINQLVVNKKRFQKETR